LSGGNDDPVLPDKVLYLLLVILKDLDQSGFSLKGMVLSFFVYPPLEIPVEFTIAATGILIEAFDPFLVQPDLTGSHFLQVSVFGGINKLVPPDLKFFHLQGIQYYGIAAAGMEMIKQDLVLVYVISQRNFPVGSAFHDHFSDNPVFREKEGMAEGPEINVTVFHPVDETQVFGFVLQIHDFHFLQRGRKNGFGSGILGVDQGAENHGQKTAILKKSVHGRFSGKLELRYLDEVQRFQ
jgi:hypothetical protein